MHQQLKDRQHCNLLLEAAHPTCSHLANALGTINSIYEQRREKERNKIKKRFFLRRVYSAHAVSHRFVTGEIFRNLSLIFFSLKEWDNKSHSKAKQVVYSPCVIVQIENERVKTRSLLLSKKRNKRRQMNCYCATFLAHVWPTQQETSAHAVCLWKALGNNNKMHRHSLVAVTMLYTDWRNNVMSHLFNSSLGYLNRNIFQSFFPPILISRHV